MVIVTGTRRSGTSMWMQLLQGAGFPAIGEAFPAQWATSIGEENPHGFWESQLRGGIYYATNPHPKTGTWLSPQHTRRHSRDLQRQTEPLCGGTPPRAAPRAAASARCPRGNY